MLNVILFLTGLIALAFSLYRWDAVLDAAGTALSSVSLAVWALIVSPVRDTLYWVRAAGAGLGVLLLVFAFLVGPSVSAGLSPRDALDKAIRDFQAYAGLTVDGIFGPATVRAYYGK